MKEGKKQSAWCTRMFKRRLWHHHGRVNAVAQGSVGLVEKEREEYMGRNRRPLNNQVGTALPLASQLINIHVSLARVPSSGERRDLRPRGKSHKNVKTPQAILESSKLNYKAPPWGNSLMVQWLELRLSLPWAWVQSLVRELRSHSCTAPPKEKAPPWCHPSGVPCPWYDVTRRHLTCMLFFPETHDPSLTLRKTGDKPNWEIFCKTPDQPSSNCQRHGNQGKTETVTYWRGPRGQSVMSVLGWRNNVLMVNNHTILDPISRLSCS